MGPRRAGVGEKDESNQGGKRHTVGVIVTPGENHRVERARPEIVKLITRLKGPLRSVLVSPLPQPRGLCLNVH